MAVDRRYKVSQEDILRMRMMRNQGISYQKIADAHGESYSTAYFWTNAEYRRKQREKVAKRVHPKGDRSRVVRDMQKRKENWKDNPDMKLRHTIQSAKDEKRATRRTVEGMDMADALKKLSSGELKGKNRKMSD